MNVEVLPLWVTIPGSLLLVIGGLMTVAGSVGLLRFPDFFARLHSLGVSNTLGAGGVVLTSLLSSCAYAGGLVVHELLIAIFVFATAPIISNLLLPAALYRNRVRETAQQSSVERQSPDQTG